jgi:hypothetical protein
LSRNIAATISAHRKSVPELCASVKVRFWTRNLSFELKCVIKRWFCVLILVDKFLVIYSHFSFVMWFLWIITINRLIIYLEIL